MSISKTGRPTCSVLHTKSDCSSPQTVSAATISTITRKRNSTESQILPREVEWRLAPTSWAYRAGQDILWTRRGAAAAAPPGWTQVQPPAWNTEKEDTGDEKEWRGEEAGDGPPPAFVWTDEPPFPLDGAHSEENTRIPVSEPELCRPHNPRFPLGSGHAEAANHRKRWNLKDFNTADFSKLPKDTFSCKMSDFCLFLPLMKPKTKKHHD